MKPNNLRDTLRGMSVIELMVAMALALIGTVVIFQVYAVNEEFRRGTTAGSDQQTNGLQALMLIERQLRHAGFGINDSALYGCKMVTYDNQHVPMNPTPYPLAAVQIFSNTGPTPDVINVMYGGTNNSAVAQNLYGPMTSATDYPQVGNPYGFLAGDIMILGQPGVNCLATIAEVTLNPGGNPVSVNELRTANGTYTQDPTLYMSTTVLSRWNNPAGIPCGVPCFDENAKVINLGWLLDPSRPPRYNQITVQTGLANPGLNNKLVVQNLWDQLPTWLPIAEQIVQLKAEYGMDDGKDNNTVKGSPFILNDGIIDRYIPDPIAAGGPKYPATPSTDWRLVKTVRVAIVARSAAPLKPTGGGACDATPAFDPSLANNTYPVRWAFGPDAPLGRPIDVSGSGADWQCYKYQVYETTVPLRNVLWSPS
ncbi:MAG TPA: PilW family protein [Burkholderiales bacterium]|nr:PilW family protein [Burkholderiales bacterium]